jgi:two-component system sensor histidine kinase BaeS
MKGMLSRLWVKLALAFVFVALVGVVLVAILANRATSVGFQQYLQTGEIGQLQDLQDNLSAFFAQQNTWDGTNTVLRRSGIGPETSGGGYFLRVINADNQTVGARGGQGRPLEDYDINLPIVVNGRQVGTLLATEAGRAGHAGEQYLDSVNQAILTAGIAAIIIALILGVLLAQGLTRPLRQLTTATQAVAAGDFNQQVTVTSNDEIGELARDFNQMAHTLEISEKQRQQLLADTAHDLRTPISIIRSHLEAMLDGVFPPTPENLAVVHEETLHLSRLVDDVRTLSLVETGHLPLDILPVDMNELVLQVVAAFVPLAEADGVELNTQLTESAPIRADAARLRQVLANLISNGLRYAPQGEEDPPAVNVTVANESDTVRIGIKDNGPGLTAEQQQQVFDRFWRSDLARSRDEGGSGLGLAIAQGIVEAHAGSISVISEPGTGTEMIVRLPKAKLD